MSRIRRLSFKQKLFISYSLVVAIIMTFVTIALYLFVRSSMEGQEGRNMVQIARRTGDQIDEFITNMSEVAIQTGLNPVCLDAFIQADQYPAGENRFESAELAAGDSVKRTLASFKVMHFGSGRISLFDSLGNYVSYGAISENKDVRTAFLSGPVLRENAAKLKAMDGKVMIILPHQDYWYDVTERKVLSVLWNIKDLDTRETFGFVEVQQLFSEIVRLLPAGDGQGIRTFLFSPEGKEIYPGGAASEDSASIYARIEAERGTGGIFEMRLPGHRSDNMVAWTSLAYSGWAIAYAQDGALLYKPVRVTGLLVFSSGLLMMLLSLGVVFAISGSLSAPLRNLRISLASVDLDNLEVSLVHDTGEDDIALLNEAFVAMFERLKRSTDQLIMSRNHEIKAQLLALQSQMDPHFIFNILSVISASARDINATRISEICDKLVSILRYVGNFERGQSVMAEEVSHAETYLELMKYRFEVGLEYTIEADPRAMGIQVPKLLLQPVVENCFKHGFSQKRPPWRVAIRTGIRGESWYIEVSDNGQAIVESVIADLELRADAFIKDPCEALHALKIGGLGLFNSLIRLKLLYGEGAVFWAGRSDEGGTKVLLGGDIA
jgi:sensor histidine kinase YesM